MIEQGLQKCKERFNQISNEIENGLSGEASKKEWRGWHDKIERRFNLFNTDKIFIVTAGMLKAGKSTLVNLLARTPDASPIGFGVDTTLRPALIKMADKDSDSEGAIYVYNTETVSDDERQRELEKIIDSIRGMESECPSATHYALSQDNLIKILCSKTGTNDWLATEPLLVIVEVPYNEDSKLFSQNNCVIFDMPGLDSIDAAISKDFDAYNAIFKECDLVLFVQSNIAPLNNTASEFINEIGKRNKATYHIVQNVMDTGWWLKDKTKGILDWVKSALGNLENRLGIAEKPTLYFANLGEAYDAILRPEVIDTKKMSASSLLKESGFEGTERKLCNDIQTNGMEKRMLHCKDELCEKLNEASLFIDEKITSITEEIKNCDSVVEKLEADYEKLSLYGEKAAEGLWGLVPPTINVSDDKMEQFERDFKDGFDAEKRKYPAIAKKAKSFKIKASHVNKFFDSCIACAEKQVKSILEGEKLCDIEIGECRLTDILRNRIESLAKELNDSGFNMSGQIFSIAENKEINIDTSALAKMNADNFYFEEKYIIFSLERKIEVSKDKIDMFYQNLLTHSKGQIERIVTKKAPAIIQNCLKEHIDACLQESISKTKGEIETVKGERGNKIADKDVFERTKGELVSLIKESRSVAL